jgi:mono/diheme cytochrome c family protein
MFKRSALAAAILAMSAGACATPPAPLYTPLSPAERARLIADGRDIAMRHCAACHAVGPTDASPRQDAAPLRIMLERYDSGALAGNLMIGVRVGHPDMPLFQLSPRGADALVEYLYAIRTPAE